MNKYYTILRSTRNKVSLPKAKSTQFTRSPFFQGYCAWLQLLDSVKTSASLKEFKSEGLLMTECTIIIILASKKTNQ